MSNYFIVYVSFFFFLKKREICSNGNQMLFLHSSSCIVFLLCYLLNAMKCLVQKRIIITIELLTMEHQQYLAITSGVLACPVFSHINFILSFFLHFICLNYYFCVSLMFWMVFLVCICFHRKKIELLAS